MGQVWLNNVGSTQGKQLFVIEAGVQTFARGDGNVGYCVAIGPWSLVARLTPASSIKSGE